MKDYIRAEIILGSIGPNGIPLVTWLLTYPRIIHAEFMTHRMLSKNASSSRAIPLERMLAMIQEKQFTPKEWMMAHKGMQGVDFFDSEMSADLDRDWTHFAKVAMEHSSFLGEKGVTKQVANRITEPFSYITVVCSGTEWSNFFGLRAHPDAEIHIQDLAYKMKSVYLHQKLGSFQELKEGEWHLPFIEPKEYDKYDLETLKKVSVARCAWTSYRTPDGKIPTIERCTKIYDQLYTSRPMHASPFEHQAMCIEPNEWVVTDIGDPNHVHLDKVKKLPKGLELRLKPHPDDPTVWEAQEWSGNFRGWIQHRKLLEGENITEIPEEGIVYPK